MESSKLPSKIGWKITLPFEQLFSLFYNPAPANLIIEEATKDEFEPKMSLKRNRDRQNFSIKAPL